MDHWRPYLPKGESLRPLPFHSLSLSLSLTVFLTVFLATQTLYKLTRLALLLRCRLRLDAAWDCLHDNRITLCLSSPLLFVYNSLYVCLSAYILYLPSLCLSLCLFPISLYVILHHLSLYLSLCLSSYSLPTKRLFLLSIVDFSSTFGLSLLIFAFVNTSVFYLCALLSFSLSLSLSRNVQHDWVEWLWLRKRRVRGGWGHTPSDVSSQFQLATNFSLLVW